MPVRRPTLNQMRQAVDRLDIEHHERESDPAEADAIGRVRDWILGHYYAKWKNSPVPRKADWAVVDSILTSDPTEDEPSKVRALDRTHAWLVQQKERWQKGITQDITLEQYLVETGDEAMQSRTAAFKAAGRKAVETSVMIPEVLAALVDLASLAPDAEWVLIGGLALGAYAKPRTTEDVDILVVSDDSMDEIAQKLSSKFKKTTKHAFEHRRTGVSLEVVTPTTVPVSEQIMKDVLASAETHVVKGYKVKVASAAGLIALKLHRATGTSTRAMQDQVDIRSILQANGHQDLSKYGLKKAEKDLYEKLWQAVSSED